MIRKGLIKTSELTRLAKLARSENVTVEIERDGVKIRVMPFDGNFCAAEPTFQKSGNGEHEWWTRKNESKSGKTFDPDAIVKRHYDSIGYDPKSMSDKDYERLYKIADAKRIAEIPLEKLLKAEKKALLQLREYGLGVLVPWQDVKGCGPSTEERLHARDFIEIRMQEEFPDRVGAYLLTEAGLKAVEAFDHTEVQTLLSAISSKRGKIGRS
ncbi:MULTISPECIES: hypothetical protein [unclassified Rhizobium]|uniref:hypothetical protein n=1 Tax=unclassified Rhizobium TaxID=2613769 RepID=UPI0007147A51|nr:MULTISPECIES: hypothetical protein [unclassified Rhizobium]KQT03244.1 hypothetical protein ASG42_24875 [Rhizobium sp. Leaf391]KQU08347.1 hypothetical protein ASG68_22410 [Rhizobium sp. Leaf453]